MRSQRIHQDPLDQTDEVLLPSLDDVAEQYLRQEEDVELREALATLPPGQRQIIELRFFADLELAEIAELLHIPLGTVKSRLHRALSLVKLRLPTRSMPYE